MRESHPEVAFAGLCDYGAIEASKLTDDGHGARLDVLEAAESGSAGVYDDLERTLIHDPPRYAPVLGSGTEDDIVDAMALAVTAKLGSEDGFEVLGGDEDGKGLPMEIVYAEPTRAE